MSNVASSCFTNGQQIKWSFDRTADDVSTLEITAISCSSRVDFESRLDKRDKARNRRPFGSVCYLLCHFARSYLVVSLQRADEKSFDRSLGRH